MGKRNTIASVVAGVLAIVVLFISISRASLDTAATKGKDLGIRNLPIEYEMDGNKQIYKLPQARMLPDDPLYIFKRIRDFLWIEFTTGKQAKSEVALFIADKKMAETDKLLSENKTNLALLTSREAFNKLQYAKKLYENDQIYYAGFAYAKILERYGQKIKELDEWNATQKKEKTR